MFAWLRRWFDRVAPRLYRLRRYSVQNNQYVALVAFLFFPLVIFFIGYQGYFESSPLPQPRPEALFLQLKNPDQIDRIEHVMSARDEVPDHITLFLKDGTKVSGDVFKAEKPVLEQLFQQTLDPKATAPKLTRYSLSDYQLLQSGGDTTFSIKVEYFVEHIRQYFNALNPQMISSLLGVVAMLIVMVYLLNMHSSFEVLQPHEIEGDLDDLVGLEEAKRTIMQIKDRYLRNEHFAHHGIGTPGNLLFSGPPGTGKTRIAGFIAKELRCPLITASAASLETGLVGGGSRTLRAIYKRASQAQRAVVFLDEGQTLMMKRGNGTSRRSDDDTINTFLTVLDGTGKQNEILNKRQIIWILASNFDENKIEIDEALLRRFPVRIRFRYPDLPERLTLLQRLSERHRNAQFSPDIQWKHVAHYTHGLSPALIDQLMQEAVVDAVAEQRPVNSDDLMRAYEALTLGVSDISLDQNPIQQARIAVHEAGHFLVHFLRKQQQSESLAAAIESIATLKISIESRPAAGMAGYNLLEQEERLLHTVDDLEWQVRELYAGLAAETIIYGEGKHSSGCSHDLTQATRYIEMLVKQMAHNNQSKLNLLALKDEASQADAFRRMEELSAALYEQTEQLLSQEKARLIDLRDKLQRELMLEQENLVEWLKASYQPMVSGEMH